MQRMRSTSKKIAIEWKIDFSEKRLFLENHSLEFHEIWHENTLGNKELEDWKEFNFNKGNSALYERKIKRFWSFIVKSAIEILNIIIIRYASEPSTRDNWGSLC